MDKFTDEMFVDRSMDQSTGENDPWTGPRGEKRSTDRSMDRSTRKKGSMDRSTKIKVVHGPVHEHFNGEFVHGRRYIYIVWAAKPPWLQERGLA